MGTQPAVEVCGVEPIASIVPILPDGTCFTGTMEGLLSVM